MTRDDSTGPDAAARRFVSVDAGGEPNAEAELASWLDAQPANEVALQRVELAVALGRQLAANPASALYFEAQRAARVRPRRVPFARTLGSGGALAAALLVALFVWRDDVVTAPEPMLRAARQVAVDAPGTASAVLPGGIVVDASAVAVLPFAGAGDGTLAAGLARDVVSTLRTVPGLYVIADAAVQPYAGTELAAPELGGLLGVRGLVDGSVELVDGRVLVSARLREAATGATLWQTQVERSVDELRAIRSEIAESVAATMLDSSLRERAARTDGLGEPASASKPFQQ
jgi:TolB-like protein